MSARSDCELFRRKLFGQKEEYKSRPSCKLFVLRMECTSWTVIQGSGLQVSSFLSLLEGGWLGNNLEFFGQVLGLFLVFKLFY